MSRPISTSMISKLLERQQREHEAAYIVWLGYKLHVEAKRARELAFAQRMGLVGESLVTSRYEGRRILSVAPTPHPNDEARPLTTNWPRSDQRVMPGSHYRPVKFSHGAAR